MYDIKVVDCPARRLAALPHLGPYATIGETFAKASAVLDDKAFWPKVTEMVGVYHDDPAKVAPAELRSHAGFTLVKGARVPRGLEKVVLPAGRTAVLRLVGPYSGLPAAYGYLYHSWLPVSGEAAAGAPPYEVYLNTPMDTAPGDLLTEICLPLQ